MTLLTLISAGLLLTIRGLRDDRRRRKQRYRRRGDPESKLRSFPTG